MRATTTTAAWAALAALALSCWRPAGAATPPYKFALSGSGGDIFFHAGVGAALYNLSLASADTQYAGASGGAIIGTLMAAGVSPARVMDVLSSKGDCGDHAGAHCDSVVGDDGGGGGKAAPPAPAGPAACSPSFKAFIPFLKLTLHSLLPGDAPASVSSKGNLHIWASQLDPSSPSISPGTGPLAFDLNAFWPPGAPSGYPSMADLIESAAASAWVPCAVGAFTFTRHRGHAWMDGGAAAGMDEMCASMPGGGPCVQVIAVAVGPKAKADNAGACPFPTSPVHPGTFPGHPGLSLAPPVLPELCERYCQVNGHSASDDFHPVLASVGGDVSGKICPGCRTATPFTFCDVHAMSKFALGSTSAGLSAGGAVAALYQLGWDEAMAWAAEQGLVAA
jgi:hypothetical protein